jgi:hypothetical protein
MRDKVIFKGAVMAAYWSKRDRTKTEYEVMIDLEEHFKTKQRVCVYCMSPNLEYLWAIFSVFFARIVII